MYCLQEMVIGCGAEFLYHVDQQILDLIRSALEHNNRFVRETGFDVCGSLVESCIHVQPGKL